MNALDRRSLLAGAGSLLLSAAAPSRPLAAAGEANQTLLLIPRLIDIREPEQTISLRVTAGKTSFYPGRPSDTLGYNGSYLGPTLRVRRGADVHVAVTNIMKAETTVHWHGLLVPGKLDGGPHQIIAQSTTWRVMLPIRQPAATLFYHSHLHGMTGKQVYLGLAGVLIVTDDEEQGLGLPARYGVDDLPLLIQDRKFEDGQLVIPPDALLGRRGDTILVNGAPAPLARVPAQLIRLRLVNGSNARIYELAFSDGRTFHWIGTEGGLLDRPVELQTMTFAPGQRAEVLVDFADGRPVSLVTGPDPNILEGAPALVLRFEPRAAVRVRSSGFIPNLLASRALPDAGKATRRRRLVLNMPTGEMQGLRTMGSVPSLLANANTLTINGEQFNMNRIDEHVRFGATEIWEVSANLMFHPFHVHGVHFDVLSRDGDKPDLLDRGPRDTVLLREPVELLMRFDHVGTAAAPFMYHCHILEHEDDGMMGQFTVV